MPEREPDLKLNIEVWFDEDEGCIDGVHVQPIPTICPAMQYYTLCVVASIIAERDEPAIAVEEFFSPN